MRVVGTYTTSHEVDIAPMDALDAVIDHLRFRNGIGKDWWLNDAKEFCVWDRWGKQMTMQKATTEQIAVMKACVTLRKFLEKAK